jgi:hypothetical protein
MYCKAHAATVFAIVRKSLPNIKQVPVNVSVQAGLTLA